MWTQHTVSAHNQRPFNVSIHHSSQLLEYRSNLQLMLRRYQKAGNRAIDWKSKALPAVVSGFVCLPPGFRFQISQHVAHVSKEAARVCMLHELQKEGIHRYDERVDDGVSVFLTPFTGEKTPAAKGTVPVNETFVIRKKGAGKGRPICLFFGRILPSKAKGCKLIGADLGLITSSGNCLGRPSKQIESFLFP